MDTRPRTSLISFCTVQLRTFCAAHSLATLCLFMTSGPDLGELPGFWGSMVFRHAPIPRKGSGNQQQQQQLDVAVRASASQSVDLGFIFPSRVISKDFKKWYSQLPCLALSTKRIARKTSRQACLFCPWARHFTECLHLYLADKWRGEAVYLSWWPSLTEDLQTKHEALTQRIYMFLHNALHDSSNYEELFSKFCKSFLPFYMLRIELLKGHFFRKTWKIF